MIAVTMRHSPAFVNVQKAHIQDSTQMIRCGALNGSRTGVKAMGEIKDSGTRREFSTGAVRDMQEGKGDMVSIPWEAILRLSRHYEAGAKKYQRFNYRKGINLSSYIDSACRHLASKNFLYQTSHHYMQRMSSS